MFLVVPRGRGCLWHLVVKAREAARHSATHGTAPQGRFGRPEGHWFQDRVSSGIPQAVREAATVRLHLGV